MREIKFRVYYQKVTDDSWVIEGEYTLKDLTDRGIQFDQERIKWVEWTGLKDRDGEEIYEGDIVRWGESEPNIIWDGTVKGEVYWLDGGFWVACKESNHFSGRIDETGHFEIIGNIYENPDMISNQPLTNK